MISLRLTSYSNKSLSCSKSHLFESIFSSYKAFGFHSLGSTNYVAVSVSTDFSINSKQVCSFSLHRWDGFQDHIGNVLEIGGYMFWSLEVGGYLDTMILVGRFRLEFIYESLFKNTASSFIHLKCFVFSCYHCIFESARVAQNRLCSVNSVSVLVNLENCNTVFRKGKSAMPPIFNVSEVFCYGFETANC